jgi:hypothetical protein
MRPPSVYAKPSCPADPAGCPCDIVRLLGGSNRVATRLLMILLSPRLAAGGDRRAAGLRRCHRAPLDPPLQTYR